MFANQKGGVGKTTTTALCAMAYAAASFRVGIRDVDTQASSTHLLTLPAFAESENVTQALPGQTDFDIILVDCPPSVTHAGFQSILPDASLVILVTSSDPLELLTTAQAFAEITRRIAPSKVRLLINRFEKGRRLSASLDEHLERVGLGKVGRLNTKLPRCEDYKRAVLHGWQEVPDGQKREAIHLLSSEIFKIVNRKS
jgi:chromosome partitioning protein